MRHSAQETKNLIASCTIGCVVGATLLGIFVDGMNSVMKDTIKSKAPSYVSNPNPNINTNKEHPNLATEIAGLAALAYGFSGILMAGEIYSGSQK